MEAALTPSPLFELRESMDNTFWHCELLLAIHSTMLQAMFRFSPFFPPTSATQTLDKSDSYLSLIYPFSKSFILGSCNCQVVYLWSLQLPACESNRNFVEGSWLGTFPRVTMDQHLWSAHASSKRTKIRLIYTTAGGNRQSAPGMYEIVVISGAVMNRSARILSI